MTPMSLEVIRDALGWCTIMNFVILLFWFLFFVFARDFVYRTHTKWFPMTQETFNSTHYKGLAYYKLTMLSFNLVPYLALRIVG